MDCIAETKAVAWIDVNADGVRDADEPPLPGVTFYADDVENQYDKAGSGVSDWHGEVDISVWLPGCPSVEFEVYPEIPAGYTMTTPFRQDSLLEFGFNYLPGVPTVTPRPAAPLCEFYSLAHIPGAQVDTLGVLDLETTSDGNVWLATGGGGVAQLNPQSNTWTIYTTEDGLASNSVYAIATTPDGTLWFATDEGVSRFDGSSWTVYTNQDGLVYNKVLDIAVGLDATLWFATAEGISHFDPQANTWSMDAAGAIFTEIAVAPSGVVWVARPGLGTSMISLPQQPGGRREWTDFHDSRYFPLSVDDIAVASDGTVWMASFDGVRRYVFETDTWTRYAHDSGHSAAISVLPENSATVIAIAPDDSIWIGMDSAGVAHLIPPADESDPNAWIIYDTRDGLADARVTSIAVASDNSVWIGTKGGLMQCAFDNKDLGKTSVPLGTP